jgi:peptidoglycan-associated lipoprotein
MVVLGAAVVSTALVACHKAPAPQPAPVQASAAPDPDSIRRVQAEEAARRAAAEEAARRKAAEDSANAAREAAARAAAAIAAAKATLLQTVHFDFDKSDIRAEDRALLDAKIPVLQASPNVMIRIAGNTDDRGSDEYNLALGQRRAAAVKAYLVQHGIAESRFETVSYGEERPVAQGADEGAWSQNRRAEFEITAGEQSLRQP